MTATTRLPLKTYSAIPLLLLCLLLCTVTSGLCSAENNAQTAPRKVIAAIPIDFPPTYFLDKSGKPVGFAIDVMNELAQRAGLKLEYVTGQAWDDVIQMVLSGKADLIPSLTIDERRKELLAFTNSVEFMPANLIVASGNHTVRGISPGLNIGVMKGSAPDNLLKKNQTIRLTTFTNLQTMLFELLAGQVDGIVPLTPNLMKLAIDAGVEGKIKVVGNPIIEAKRGIALRKGDTELLTRLDKAIDEFVGTPEHQLIYAKWYGKPKLYWTVGKISAVGGMFLVLILCGMVFWRYRSILQLNNSLAQSIAERERAVEELRGSEQQLSLLLASTAEAIYGVDLEGNCTFANPSCIRMLGLDSAADILGKNIHDLIHYKRPDGTPFLSAECDKLKTIQEGKICHADDEVFLRADGSSVYVEYRSYPIIKDGRLLGAVVTFLDISERKRTEEERLQLEKQLLHAQKLESLGVLAGGIAHDFNNILTSIMGNADLALMRLNPESPAVDNLRRIEQSAVRAADLAKQMLAYSGKGKFVIEQLDINRLVEEMLHMLEVSISKKAVLRLNLHQPLPGVAADATQLRQIIMNLVINASEAIGDKSGVIAITTGCMECDHNYLKDVWLDENLNEGLYVYLEIADSGCGMDRGTLAKIFDPFFTTKLTGRGLGMAAVMGIVRGHKGAIKVYSEPKKGTTFKVLFPADSRPAELFDSQPSPEEWQGCGTVLLVDDEETVRAIGSEMLRELGFKVITADDGRHALEQYKAHDGICLVILDLTMPHLDGEQTFRELRRINSEVKVIMSSGYNESEVTQKFAGKGLSGFIQKPYRMSVFKEVLGKLNNT